MTVTLEQIAIAKDAERVAASQSYQAFAAAKATLQQLEAAYATQQPRRHIVVGGDTYAARRDLKALGLTWSPMARAWVGTVRADVVLPRGCYETTFGAAVVASMDHAESMA